METITANRATILPNVPNLTFKPSTILKQELNGE